MNEKISEQNIYKEIIEYNQKVSKIVEGYNGIINAVFQLKGGEILISNEEGKKIIGDSTTLNLEELIETNLYMPPFISLLKKYKIINSIKSLELGLIGMIEDKNGKITFLQLIGKLFKNKHNSSEDFFQCQLIPLEAIRAIPIMLKKMVNDKTTKEVIEFIIRISKEEDPIDTGPHIKRVQINYYILSDIIIQNKELFPGWNNDIYEDNLHNAAKWSPLHDIGKLTINESVLHKKEAFSSYDWAYMETHVINGETIGKIAGVPENALNIIRYHHAWWDGRKHKGISPITGKRKPGGYPYQISGYEIPIEGQIMAIVDWVDAVAAKRTYKKGWPKEKVINTLQNLSGKQFNPDLVNLVIKNYDKFIFQWSENK